MTFNLANRWPVYVSSALLLIITAIFVVEFIASSEAEVERRAQQSAAQPPAYDAAQIAQIVAKGNIQRGAALVEQYGCAVCHRLGAVNQDIAPAFAGIAERAAIREPGLSAPEYLYESIINPAAFVVEGYNPVMPQNYPDRLTEDELGDILAYLLSPDAN